MSAFTKRYIDALEITGKDYFIWDKEVPGFGLKVSAAGKKTFVIQYRNEMRQTKRLTLGTYPALHPQVAKEKALLTWTLIHKGEDPSKSKFSSGVLLFQELWIEYKAALVNARTLRQVETIERLYLQSLLVKPVLEITRAYICNQLQSLERRPIMYRTAITYIRAAFNKALMKDKISTNPARYIKTKTAKKVVRWLTPEETVSLLATLNNEKPECRDFFLFLYYTGARSGEVKSLKWEYLSLSERTWLKPAKLTKQARDSYIPLSEDAFEVLMRQDRTTDLVFPNAPLTISPWYRIIKKAGIQNFRIHDLRHNFASMLVSRGVSLEVIGKLLGHSSYQTTQRYAHLSHDALKDALDKLNQK